MTIVRDGTGRRAPVARRRAAVAAALRLAVVLVILAGVAAGAAW